LNFFSPYNLIQYRQQFKITGNTLASAKTFTPVQKTINRESLQSHLRAFNSKPLGGTSILSAVERNKNFSILFKKQDNHFFGSAFLFHGKN